MLVSIDTHVSDLERLGYRMNYYGLPNFARLVGFVSLWSFETGTRY